MSTPAPQEAAAAPPPATAATTAGTATSPSPRAPPIYSLSAIASAAGSETATLLADPAASAASVWRNPCFRHAFLWGVGVGGLLGLHRLKQRGGGGRAGRDAGLGGGGTLAAQWYLCRKDDVDRRVALRAFYARQAAAAAAEEGAGGAGGAGSGGAARDEDWRGTIERMTAYELPVVVEGGAAAARHGGGAGSGGGGGGDAPLGGGAAQQA